jgi:hypothetical protein
MKKNTILLALLLFANAKNLNACATGCFLKLVLPPLYVLLVYKVLSKANKDEIAFAAKLPHFN